MTHEDNFHNCPKLIFKQSVTLVLRAMDKCAAPRPQEIQQAVVSEDDSPLLSDDYCERVYDFTGSVRIKCGSLRLSAGCGFREMSHEAIENERLGRRDGVADTEACPDAGWMSADEHLFREYLSTRSEDAFANSWHVIQPSFILRLCGRPGTGRRRKRLRKQSLSILARKTAAIRSETQLRGWLFRAVRYAAMDSQSGSAQVLARTGSCPIAIHSQLGRTSIGVETDRSGYR